MLPKLRQVNVAPKLRTQQCCTLSNLFRKLWKFEAASWQPHAHLKLLTWPLDLLWPLAVAMRMMAGVPGPAKSHAWSLVPGQNTGL